MLTVVVVVLLLPWTAFAVYTLWRTMTALSRFEQALEEADVDAQVRPTWPPETFAAPPSTATPHRPRH